MAALSLTLTACGSDDEPNNDSGIVGIWLEEADDYYLCFKADGTWRDAWIDSETGIMDNDSWSGTYRIDGDKLYRTVKATSDHRDSPEIGKTIEERFKVSRTELMLTDNDWENATTYVRKTDSKTKSYFK